MDYRHNWARTHNYVASASYAPATLEEIQQYVSSSRKVRVRGAGHSFNGIEDFPETMLSLENFNRVLTLDRERHTATVEGGIKLGDLFQYLHSQGYAFHNTPSLPHITLAGAIATATHGSGDINGNLSTGVSALEFIAADGSIKTLSRELDGEQFQGAVVNLGGIGVVTKVTIDLVPTFEMRQSVYENLPLSQMENHFDEIMASAYSVSLFTDWRSGRFNIWIKRKITADADPELQPEWLGATLATNPLHPIPNPLDESCTVESCTEQMGIPGPWNERLPHFRIEFTPSSSREHQSEYFVPRAYALKALLAVYKLREQIAPHLQISEVRTIAGDDLWMSTCYRQPSVAIHFTWKKHNDEIQIDSEILELMPKIEASLAPFGARPHWGKLFRMEAKQLQSLYPRLHDFRGLLQESDQDGKFRNAFLDKFIF